MAGSDDAIGEARRPRRLRLPRLAGALRHAPPGHAADAPAEGSGPRAAWRSRIDARALARAAALRAVAHLPAVAAGLAASIPILNSTIRAANAGWVPAGDDGIIATRGWDVLTSHTPLVGQYSEAGLVVHGQVMHSPGPLLYWLIALPARFGAVTSIAVTMGVLNTLAVIVCVVLARRRGGLPLMFMAAVGIALITQTHLMYAAPTVVLVAVAAGGLALPWLERRRRRRRARASPRHEAAPVGRGVWRWALAAGVVTLACWAAPIADQIENNPGNMSMIVNTIEHRGSALGSGVGWNAVVRPVGIRPWWLYVPATEWDRKYDVGAVPRQRGGPLDHPSGGEVDSAIVIIGALAATAAFAVFMLQWDLAAAVLIGLGMCAAIGLQAASNPAPPLLAGTLGYTLWWGSELGFWVWLVLAWAIWMGLASLTKPARRALRRRLRARGRTPPPRARLLATAVASLGALGGTVAVGSAVADTARPDSHHIQYQPVRTVAAGIARAIPPHQTINFKFGTLDLGTQPTEPAIRFLLVRHGDRVLANGSFPRLGSYYELYHRPVQWTVFLTDAVAPKRHFTLAARVRFVDGWGHETLSAWVRHLTPTAAAAPTTRHR